MFEQSSVIGTGKTRRAWTVPLGFAAQVAVVAGLAMVPQVFVETIPVAHLMPPQLMVPGTYHPPMPPSVKLVSTGQEQSRGRFVAPPSPAKGIHLGPDRPLAPPEFVETCVGPCVPFSPGASTPTLLGQRPALPPVEPPPPPVRPGVKPKPVATPVPVSSVLQEAKLIRRVVPIYPKVAIAVRASGVVHLQAIIGADGHIRDLQVLGGHPLLVRAAVDAVEQWAYTPTILNGVAVEVVTEITVTFTLSR